MSVTRLSNPRRVSAASISAAGGVYGINPEAIDWRARVISNSGTVSDSTFSAINTFCMAIASAGIRDRFYRLNLFCGDQLAAALVPLYRAESQSASARGNTSDTNNNFVSGDFNNTGSASGLKANGTTKFLATGVPANAMSASNAHIGVGLRATDTTNTSTRTAIGAYNGSNNSFELGLRNASAPSVFFTRFATATDRMGDNASNATLSAGDLLAAWPTFFRNGVSAGSAATTSQDYPSAHGFHVFALNNSGSSAISNTDARINWYSIGLTMTAAQALSFYNAIAAFNTALSRT